MWFRSHYTVALAYSPHVVSITLYRSIYIVDQVEQWRRQLDKWGEGGDIYSYILVLPNLKSIRFLKIN